MKMCKKVIILLRIFHLKNVTSFIGASHVRIHTTVKKKKQTSAWLLLNQRQRWRVAIIVEINGRFGGDRQRRRGEPHRVITVRKLVLEMPRLFTIIKIQRVTPRIVPEINMIRPITTTAAVSDPAAAVTPADAADERFPLGTSQDLGPLPHLAPPWHPPALVRLEFIHGSYSLPPYGSSVTRRLRWSETREEETAASFGEHRFVHVVGCVHFRDGKRLKPHWSGEEQSLYSILWIFPSSVFSATLTLMFPPLASYVFTNPFLKARGMGIINGS